MINSKTIHNTQVLQNLNKIGANPEKIVKGI
jgi:hypothetical protein